MAKKRALRLPKSFAYTALRVSVAGAIACTGSTATSPAEDASADGTSADASMDAAADASLDAATSDATDDTTALDSPSATDAGDACTNPTMFCGPAAPDASCPGAICSLSDCPLDAGCEPFV